MDETSAAEQPAPGVAVPVDADGRRSTSALGRRVLADAVRSVDPAAALAVEQETNWRGGYPAHFRRAVEAGLASAEAATTIARDGLAALHERLVVTGLDGTDRPLAEWTVDGPTPATYRVDGEAEPLTELVLPYRGQRLRGDALHRLLSDWTRQGVIEPSVGTAVRTVAEHPEWLRLEGRTVAVLGAGSEMGPMKALLRWGATVAAVDLPRPAIWRRVLGEVRERAGTLLLPGDTADPDTLGLDLTRAAPVVADWLAGLDGRLVLGNYVYADGVDNLRVAMAVDALGTRLGRARPDTALAFLATPTDVFAVPGEAVAASVAAYDARPRRTRLLSRPLRTISAGRLLARQYVAGSDPGVHDALVPQQGPNYALAKRLQRWRAAVERAEGRTVSLNVAPPTRTRSVVKNRALAAAYAGAHRFGIEVFDPATSNVLMAALLVHDLHVDPPSVGEAPRHPWQDEARTAVHGGLWRAPYAPRSALGLAAVLGYGSSRT